MVFIYIPVHLDFICSIHTPMCFDLHIYVYDYYNHAYIIRTHVCMPYKFTYITDINENPAYNATTPVKTYESCRQIVRLSARRS
jgi:hypothetical protein